MVLPILGVLALWVVQTLLPSTLRYTSDRSQLSQNIATALGARDDPPEMPVLGARAQRAVGNMLEALPVFISIALLLEIRGDPSSMAVGGAWFFLGARVLYVPAYLSAIPGLRSLMWMSSWVGLGAMISQLF